jgi:hypothetical protein
LKHTIIASIFIAVLLSSCSPAVPAPTPLTPSETSALATATPLLLTPTPEPAPPEIPGLIPVVDYWEGVPVMPGAISGMFELGDYIFTISATEDEIGSFYQMVMADLGWEPREDMIARVPGTSFTYYHDGGFVFFMIQPDGGNNRVLMHFVEE